MNGCRDGKKCRWWWRQCPHTQAQGLIRCVLHKNHDAAYCTDGVGFHWLTDEAKWTAYPLDAYHQPGNITVEISGRVERHEPDGKKVTLWDLARQQKASPSSKKRGESE